MPPSIYGWKTTQKESKSKKKKKERKTEVIFLSFLYFCLFYGKITFVWLLVDNSWIVCCCLLPDSYGQTKKMAEVRLPFVCHSYWCFLFQEHSGQIAPQGVQQGSCTCIQSHAKNCERRHEGKCSCSIFNFVWWIQPSLLLVCAPDEITPHHQVLGVLTTHLVWRLICFLGRERFSGPLGQRDWNGASHSLVPLRHGVELCPHPKRILKSLYINGFLIHRTLTYSEDLYFFPIKIKLAYKQQ